MKTETIELTLEESGILCHLMMGEREFRNYVMRRNITSDQPIFERWVALYAKLAAANDRLMGKVPNLEGLEP